jgi:hypothetical protein
MQTVVATDLAPRLRMAVARTARRLRQEAGGGLSPSLAAALATIDRHGPLTPSELAAASASSGPPPPARGPPRRGRLVARTPDPRTGAAA